MKAEYREAAGQRGSQTAGLDCGPAPDIYTPDQRLRRDSTIWTPVQGVLAALQFVVFLVSLVLVVRFIMTGEGFWVASISVCVKTLILLTIMVTGSLWEKAVFDQYLFAPMFFWEDVVSFLVIVLHLLYVAAFLFNLAPAGVQMVIALAAYAAYVVNAGQFLWKFKQARGGGSQYSGENHHAIAPDPLLAVSHRKATS